jgi:hypothetical protein
MRWSGSVLVILLLFDIWYRAHTFGPQIRDSLGFSIWPTTIGAAEPLDCDEAAYAFIGHRILSGDVLYRDVTETRLRWATGFMPWRLRLAATPSWRSASCRFRSC